MSDWFTCIICGTYLSESQVKDHVQGQIHYDRVRSDHSGVIQYVFRCDEPDCDTLCNFFPIAPTKKYLQRAYAFHFAQQLRFPTYLDNCNSDED